VLLSCGGISSAPGGSSEPRDAGKASNEAIDVARREGGVPASANLVSIRSSPSGDTDERGGSSQWIVIFWDDGAKTEYHGNVTASGADITPSAASLSCGNDVLVAVDSRVVLPDALVRFGATSEQQLVYFYEQHLACVDDRGTKCRWVQVLRSLTTSPVARSASSYFQYDDDGKFVRRDDPTGPGDPNCVGP
jgi:hypothetical protein